MNKENDKRKDRCLAIVSAFENDFQRAIPVFTSHFWEFQTCPDVDQNRFYISKPIVIDAVSSYFRDLDRYKAANGFNEQELADFAKVGAFTTYWLAMSRPVYDTNQSRYAHLVNLDFAIFSGLTFAELSPLTIRRMGDGVIYRQLEQMLKHDAATPDAIVAIYEGLRQVAKKGVKPVEMPRQHQ
jgi:hypothetical protein